jgi:peptidoglycan hydrolase CwlO-like protein
MNKLFIVLSVVVVLGIGVLFLVNTVNRNKVSQMDNQVIQEVENQLTPQVSVTQMIQPTSAVGITAKTTQSGAKKPEINSIELNQNLQKELDQLDADIKAGNKEILTDNDFDM